MPISPLLKQNLETPSGFLGRDSTHLLLGKCSLRLVMTRKGPGNPAHGPLSLCPATSFTLADAIDHGPICLLCIVASVRDDELCLDYHYNTTFSQFPQSFPPPLKMQFPQVELRSLYLESLELPNKRVPYTQHTSLQLHLYSENMGGQPRSSQPAPLTVELFRFCLFIVLPVYMSLHHICAVIIWQVMNHHMDTRNQT